MDISLAATKFSVAGWPSFIAADILPVPVMPSTHDETTGAMAMHLHFLLLYLSILSQSTICVNMLLHVYRFPGAPIRQRLALIR